MTPSRIHDEDEEVPLAVPADPEDPTPAYDCEITLSRERPAECTIYPSDAVGIERLTAWVTATEGSFVGLDDLR